jgi:hypothetical protein
MPPGVAAAPTPSVRTSVGSIADRPSARQRSAATARASPSVTDVNAFSQSPGPCSAERRQADTLGLLDAVQRSGGAAGMALRGPYGVEHRPCVAPCAAGPGRSAEEISS